MGERKDGQAAVFSKVERKGERELGEQTGARPGKEGEAGVIHFKKETWFCTVH